MYDNTNNTKWNVTPEHLRKLLHLNKTKLLPNEHAQLIKLTHGVYQPNTTPTTIKELFDLIPDIKQVKHKTVDLSGCKKDKELQIFFKESHHQYYANRRLKMSSVVKYTGTRHASKLTNLPYHLALNIMIWLECLTDEEQEYFINTNIVSSEEEFVTLSSEISERLKPFGNYTDIKHKFGELQSLTGYKFADETWNLEEEIIQLSKCNPRRTREWERDWDQALDDTIERPLCLPNFIGFEEYVTSMKWSTTGSSSIGRILYTDKDGKIKHFKPRKNMVTAIMTPEEIWDKVVKWDGKIKNIPVVKNELGKIRLAIASNFESYVYEAYCLDMFGHSFKNWGSITLDESVKEEIDRSETDMTQIENGCYALPWDFAKFDHQVRTSEITSILSRLKEYSHQQTHEYWDKIIQSYSNAEIYDPSTKKTYPITNGLQSGQRTTSLIGNVWNAIVTRAVQNKVSTLLGYVPKYRLGIRGDDTYILANTCVELYLIRLAYASFQIIGHDKKFSIRQNSFEFLRNTTYKDQIVGWAPRAIPAITQRKPWSDDMLLPHLEVITIAENINNYERRAGTEVKNIHAANKFQWSKFTRQSYMWLELPRRMGGLGIYPFRQLIPDGKLSLTPEVEVKIDTKTSDYSPKFMNLTEEQSQKYNFSRFKSMLRPSDMRNLLSDIITSFKDKIKKMKRIKWSRIRVNSIKVDLMSSLSREQKPGVKHNLQSDDPSWPRFDEFLSIYPHWRFADDKIASLASIMKEKYNRLASWLKIYEKLGYHRSDGISMLLGTPPLENIWPLNTKTKNLVSSMLIGNWEWPPPEFRRRDKIGLYIYQVTRKASEAFQQTRISNMFKY